MKVPEKVWVNYIESLAKVSTEAADKMRKYLETYDLEAEQWRNAIITTAHAFAVKYGEAAAALACDMYDSMAEASGWTVPPAEPAETATMEETAKAVNGTLKQYLDVMQVAETVGRLVKTTGQDTTLKNAERDGAQFAWIPHGDTCPFCMILASRGWQHMSKKALKNGHAEHIHPHCDCAYGIRFDSSTTYDGYDPDKYLQMYEDAEGDTWKDKMNYMRREQHAQEKDVINTLEQETHAVKKASESRQIKDIIGLYSKYGSPDGLMIMGTSDELTRYSELLKETGLTQDQVLDKMFEDPDYWETILSSQNNKQLEVFIDQLLDTANDEELSALNMWTGETYKIIQRQMRYGEEIDEISENAARHIESVLDRMETPEKIIAKRGTGTTQIFKQIGTTWGG